MTTMPLLLARCMSLNRYKNQKMKTHKYHCQLTWTGDRGEGTKSYKAYDRSHKIEIKGKSTIKGSSDPSFLGDPTKHNPEELLVASLSSCHMLWYLHLCSTNGIRVRSYSDTPVGSMLEEADGAGRFSEVVLRPIVQIDEADNLDKAALLHKEAHKKCFIANSVNFRVRCEHTIGIFAII